MHSCAPTWRAGKDNFKCNNYKIPKIRHIEDLRYWPINFNRDPVVDLLLLCSKVTQWLKCSRRSIIRTFRANGVQSVILRVRNIKRFYKGLLSQEDQTLVRYDREFVSTGVRFIKRLLYSVTCFATIPISEKWNQRLNRNLNFVKEFRKSLSVLWPTPPGTLLGNTSSLKRMGGWPKPSSLSVVNDIL